MLSPQENRVIDISPLPLTVRNKALDWHLRMCNRDPTTLLFCVETLSPVGVKAEHPPLILGQHGGSWPHCMVGNRNRDLAMHRERLEEIALLIIGDP